MTLLNNRYQILNELGRGGFGHTFLAEDTHLPSRRRCVIKQFKPANNDPKTLPRLQERFGREASILEQVGEEHSQIPRLYAYFVEEEQFYLVQELIDGQTLGQKVRADGPLECGMVREIISSLLGILDYLHANDIIHRDIKPDNIIYRKRDGKPVLIDFGTVKETVTTVYDEGGAPTSLIIGSPGYMPMEQAVGLAVYASDLYSVGWTAIYLMTGKQPSEMVDRRTGENRWRGFVPSVDNHFAEVIDKAVQRASSDRYETASEMLQALHPTLPETVYSPTPEPEPPNLVTTPPIAPELEKIKPVIPTPIMPEPEIARPVIPAPIAPETEKSTPAIPTPITPEPLAPQPESSGHSTVPIAPLVTVVESDYFLEPADRWRIPLLNLLLYVVLVVGGLGGSIIQIIWAGFFIGQAFLFRKYIRPIAWSGAMIAGIAIAQIISANDGSHDPYQRYYDPYYSRYYFNLEMIIILLGVGQWLVLRKYVTTAQKWLHASLATAVVIFLVNYIERVARLFTVMPLNWPLAGLMLGITQAYLLRNFVKTRSGEKIK